MTSPPALLSKVIFIGENPPLDLNTEIKFYPSFNTTPQAQLAGCEVLIFSLNLVNSLEVEKHLRLLLARKPSLQLIVIANSTADNQAQNILQLINKFPLSQILENLQAGPLDHSILLALEKSQQHYQNQQLESLAREQNENLRQLQSELEDRVQKRQTYLIESKAKTELANSRWETLLKASEAIQQAETLGEIESALTQILAAEMDLLHTRVQFSPQDQIFWEQQKAQHNLTIHRSHLTHDDDKAVIGSVFFIRGKDHLFRREEIDFLQKIVEVIALAVGRLDQLQRTVTFKEHWEATFNAVAEPVIIINQNYEVVQSNSAVSSTAQSTNSSTSSTSIVAAKKCFEMLFARTSPCESCQLGKSFRIDLGKSGISTFEVFSQLLPVNPDEPQLYVNQYHNITQKLKMEKRIVENARLAEIGTIGSSIAHELNNPLGGMLSFAQLIRMDLSPTHPHYQDVVELENGMLRCKDIIHHLLGFVRTDSHTSASAILDLRLVMARALKINELQSRSLGVEIKWQDQAQPILIEGSFDQLAQALQNILWNTLQSFAQNQHLRRGLHGIIEIQIFVQEKDAVIKILDNGPDLENRPGLGLSLAEQILHEHGGKIEFLADSKPFRTVKIFLPQKASLTEGLNR